MALAAHRQHDEDDEAGAEEGDPGDRQDPHTLAKDGFMMVIPMVMVMITLNDLKAR